MNLKICTTGVMTHTDDNFHLGDDILLRWCTQSNKDLCSWVTTFTSARLGDSYTPNRWFTLLGDDFHYLWSPMITHTAAWVMTCSPAWWFTPLGDAYHSDGVYSWVLRLIVCRLLHQLLWHWSQTSNETNSPLNTTWSQRHQNLTIPFLPVGV